MPFRIKISLIILAVVVGLFVVLPLVLPIEPPDGVRPLEDVAGPDATYLEINGVRVHYTLEYYWGAARSDVTYLMLHGFAYSAESFEEVAPLLSNRGDVIAFDRPGFGLTERLTPNEYAGGFDPYAAESQPLLALAVLDALGVDSAVIVGHGDGARVALEVALAAPERVDGLVLIGAAPYVQTGRSALSRMIMRTPQMQRVGPVMLRQLASEPGLRIIRAGWADPEKIDQDTIRDYTVPLTVEGWDQALWLLSLAEAPEPLVGRLGGIRAPTLLIVGEGDTVVPASESERLAVEMPNTELLRLPGCGHVAHEECPEAVAAAVEAWLR